ncbi:MAG TPA: hypothetical protein VFL80_09530 [Thermoanaerobaculia bacterium]|nr:hypothetical protein [Thermoanaerobaculia bacterium]
MISSLLALFPALRLIPPPAYVVGGAIRDLILGRQPLDVDVVCARAVSCSEGLGGRVIPLGGERFVSYRVVLEGKVYDFSDLTGGNVENDLARRDFTANAIAVDLANGTTTDPFGGAADIERRLVRMIRGENLREDPLRALKGVRMAVTLEFQIEPATLEAIRAVAPLMQSVAAERVNHELTLIFSAGRLRKAVALLRETDLDTVLFGRTLGAEDYREDAVSVAGSYALLVEDPVAFARRWRWSEALLRQVVTLRDLLRGEGDRRIALFDAGESVSRQLPAALRARGEQEEAAIVETLLRPELFATRELLTGEEIGRIAGVPPGPELGRRKRALLEAQLRGEIGTREEAEHFVRSIDER